MKSGPTNELPESRHSFVRRVQRAACHLARTRSYFNADDIARIVTDIPPGVDRRIVGPALNGLRSEELIEPVAYIRLETKRCHGRPQSLWRAKDPEACRRWLACNPPGPEDPPTSIQLSFPF